MCLWTRASSQLQFFAQLLFAPVPPADRIQRNSCVEIELPHWTLHGIVLSRVATRSDASRDEKLSFSVLCLVPDFGEQVQDSK